MLKLRIFFQELYLLLSSQVLFLIGLREKPFVPKKESRGLIVLIPGLSAHPLHWNTYVKLIGEGYDILTPYIPHMGHCSLEDAAAKLLQQIKSYCAAYPKRPLCLIGHSNGARIAYYIDLELRKEFPHTPLLVTSLAGVPLGSPIANFGKHISPAYADLTYQNEKLHALLKQLQDPLPAGMVRKYLRYAATEDPFLPVESAFTPAQQRGKRCAGARGGACDIA